MKSNIPKQQTSPYINVINKSATVIVTIKHCDIIKKKGHISRKSVSQNTAFGNRSQTKRNLQSIKPKIEEHV
jgi:hypothetical protein